MKTRAAVLRGANEPLSIEEISLSGPKAEEVLVEIQATAVCHSDLNGARDISTPMPCVLGHEGSGTVREVGEGVTHVSPGDPVVLSWLPYCGECFYCQQGQPHLCEVVIPPLFNGTLLDGGTRFEANGEKVFHYSLLSTFSQFTVVPARSCILLPPEMPLGPASLLGCGVATGFGAAVHSAKVTPGSSVAVFGLGGVGMAAIQGSLFRNAETIIGVDLKEGNFAQARRFGATHTFTPDEFQKQFQELTSGRGVDFAIDTTGSVRAARQAWESARNGGVVSVVGAFGEGDLSLPSGGFHRKGKVLRGTFYGDMDPIHGIRELVDLYLQGHLVLDDLILAERPLEEINEVMKAFESPYQANSGRTLLTF